MFKGLAKKIFKDYNNIIQLVNNYLVSEKDYIYGHCKEFIRLRKNIKKEAHRVISTKSLSLHSENKIYGSVLDINGNTYDFEIFEDGNYRIVEVKKYKYEKELRGIANEKYV